MSLAQRDSTGRDLVLEPGVHSPSPLDYEDFLPSPLREALLERAASVEGVPGLSIDPSLRQEFPAIETPEALSMVCEVYRSVSGSLERVLAQRQTDREHIDAVTLASVRENEAQQRGYMDPDYATVLGKRDAQGRVVVGPHPQPPETLRRVTIPDFLQGEQITLFGPPDTEKMSINAMNALHRRRPGEPALVQELVERSGQVPRWGADNEDSKTPIMRSFLSACQNLVGCFEGTLAYDDPRSGKAYRLCEEGRSLPIKRIPGLALPDGSHLLDGRPLPLHLVDFVLHLFHSWRHPEALIFYVPKLENEEEASYLKELIQVSEAALQRLHPEYKPGSVGVFIVFESPRSIFRIQEIAEALHPHFLGGSLGWHDFLASTARLFRHDARYRIPVKADPNIVIHHIKESHQILVEKLSPLGAIRIGGMYGTLFEEGNQDSYSVSMVGYIRDVVTQLRRGLDGFWVAHPDFVRIGVALVEAWRSRERDPQDDSLERLIVAIVPDEDEHPALLSFLRGEDVSGLSREDPLYQRGVLAADIETSLVIANDDPEEVRYNLFQAIQYLTDWLCGNGCVALPATLKNGRGESVFVRIMDDLATTERSRWELWAEVQHGRVSRETFEGLLEEELRFIRAGEDSPLKRVQVRWEGEAARWYPIAERLLRQLVLDPDPPEFVSELLMPFTFDCIRESEDPWARAQDLCPDHFRAF